MICHLELWTDFYFFGSVLDSLSTFVSREMI